LEKALDSYRGGYVFIVVETLPNFQIAIGNELFLTICQVFRKI